MRYLFLNAYFFPELTADTHLEQDLLEALVEDNNEIVIITPSPTRGVSLELKKKYKYKKKEKLFDGKVIVKRFWAPSEPKNSILRAIRYLWCDWREYCIAVRENDIDLVFAFSTPPIQGYLGIMVKKYLIKKSKKAIPFLYYLEDIFPDTLVASKLTKHNSIAWKIGRRLEDYIYKNSDCIITISDSCKTNILQKGVNEDKIVVIENWIDLDDVKYVSREENDFFDKFCLDKNDFYIVYAGNLGKAQNIDIILNCAILLRNNNRIKFLIFGSGNEESRIKKRIVDENVRNVFLYPLQPLNMVSKVYSLGDVGLVICKKGFGKSALPSKTWTIMATSRPIIASFDLDSDLYKIISSTKSGYIVEAENNALLTSAIEKMYFNSIFTRMEMGNNSLLYVKKNRNKKVSVKKFIELFTSFSLTINSNFKGIRG